MSGKSRTLKIEAEGDRYKEGLKPKIRLSGRWLEQAGFIPGCRVKIIHLARGKLELQLIVSAEVPPTP